MENISPIYSTRIPIEYQHYVDVLEKTNQQLGLWMSSLGVLVSALGVLFAVLSIVVGIYGFWKYKSHKKELEEQLDAFMASVNNQIQNQINAYDDRFGNLLKIYEGKLEETDGKQKDVIENLINDLQRERLRAISSIGVQKNDLIDVGSGIKLLPGSLIMGETLDWIYWYGYDGQRYAFPNQDVLKSWFPTFNEKQVQKITDRQLASITLVRNMFYKPGSRLIKISSDPKIYAVGQNGLIHWIYPESVIQELYGPNWKTNLVTVKDVYFVDYRVGERITNSANFNPDYLQMTAQLP